MANKSRSGQGAVAQALRPAAACSQACMASRLSKHVRCRWLNYSAEVRRDSERQPLRKRETGIRVPCLA